MCAAHWQAVLAALVAAGGMAVIVAEVEAADELDTIGDLTGALADVAAQCPWVVLGAPFQAIMLEACSVTPQVIHRLLCTLHAYQPAAL